MSDLRDAAMSSKAWPFEEARRVLKRYEKQPPKKGYVLFQTGYGPSGLPHIGTFGEVARTTMVRRAFEMISDIPTKLLCFSDDMDGFRKVPGNVPMQEELKEDLNLPLTQVRDPFGTHEGFAQHNNARLCDFLDSFGFDYEFASSTEYYKSGRFDEALIKACEVYDKIMAIMLPTLGPERQATYSPFLPISPKTGHVLQVPMVEVNADKGTVVYDEPDGERVEIPVTGGNVKMQWKPDWAMRWAALGVDYEMSGKDLIDSVTQATKICRALGAVPPVTLTYELFNDELGQKISKSKGNGLSMEEWLTYAAPESLSYFMYQKPKTAKRLYFDVIPKAVDEYHQQLRAYPDQDLKGKLANPVRHIHGADVPESDMLVPFAMLLNLASVSAAEDKAQMWGFIQRYAPDATPESNPGMDAAAEFAVRYYNDFVKPARVFRAPTEQEQSALADLAAALKDVDVAKAMIAKKNEAMGQDADLSDFSFDSAEDLQSLVFAVGKNHGFENLREWFKALYEVLLGASQGPRFGGFIALYGVEDSIKLIEDGLAGKLANSAE
ncbi:MULTISPECIES: lysine--tRNA ligase [Halocynthiibacter]|uniref:Lysine--tRNA ligase n=1 Tax=Halocynthiibacter halioticoli TaxID=2986804 RepID=A0AAE3IWS5_9RHOB|nr:MULTISPECIES: lysine--tRNA ligase [Halocynthiibacter]MCV6823570.1 lysine--tRNA ligase [Halocynthiibacter halioticoli]MCW4056571.1 lysine--tRNA ligase [Halocynthiibacter sp. SDUM655004]